MNTTNSENRRDTAADMDRSIAVPEIDQDDGRLDGDQQQHHHERSIDQTTSVVIDPILCYLNNHRHTTDSTRLTALVRRHFSDRDIDEAYRRLRGLCPSIDSQRITKSENTNPDAQKTDDSNEQRMELDDSAAIDPKTDDPGAVGVNSVDSDQPESKIDDESPTSTNDIVDLAKKPSDDSKCTKNRIPNNSSTTNDGLSNIESILDVLDRWDQSGRPLPVFGVIDLTRLPPSPIPPASVGELARPVSKSSATRSTSLTKMELTTMPTRKILAKICDELKQLKSMVIDIKRKDDADGGRTFKRTLKRTASENYHREENGYDRFAERFDGDDVNHRSTDAREDRTTGGEDSLSHRLAAGKSIDRRANDWTSTNHQMVGEQSMVNRRCSGQASTANHRLVGQKSMDYEPTTRNATDHRSIDDTSNLRRLSKQKSAVYGSPSEISADQRPFNSTDRHSIDQRPTAEHPAEQRAIVEVATDQRPFPGISMEQRQIFGKSMDQSQILQLLAERRVFPPISTLNKNPVSAVDWRMGDQGKDANDESGNEDDPIDDEDAEDDDSSHSEMDQGEDFDENEDDDEEDQEDKPNEDEQNEEDEADANNTTPPQKRGSSRSTSSIEDAVAKIKARGGRSSGALSMVLNRINKAATEYSPNPKAPLDVDDDQCEEGEDEQDDDAEDQAGDEDMDDDRSPESNTPDEAPTKTDVPQRLFPNPTPTSTAVATAVANSIAARNFAAAMMEPRNIFLAGGRMDMAAAAAAAAAMMAQAGGVFPHVNPLLAAAARASMPVRSYAPTFPTSTPQTHPLNLESRFQAPPIISTSSAIATKPPPSPTAFKKESSISAPSFLQQQQRHGKSPGINKSHTDGPKMKKPRRQDVLTSPTLSEPDKSKNEHNNSDGDNSSVTESNHGTGKPYVCTHDNCDKRFSNKFLLKKHEFIHTGLRPHQCPYCFKKFNRKDNLLRHKVTHEKNYTTPRRRTCRVFGVKGLGGIVATNPTAIDKLGSNDLHHQTNNNNASSSAESSPRSLDRVVSKFQKQQRPSISRPADENSTEAAPPMNGQNNNSVSSILASVAASVQQQNNSAANNNSISNNFPNGNSTMNGNSNGEFSLAALALAQSAFAQSFQRAAAMHSMNH